MEVDSYENDGNIKTLPFASKSVLFRYKVFTNKTNYTDLVLTKKFILYEIKNNNILLSCDLSNTALKGTLNCTLIRNVFI